MINSKRPLGEILLSKGLITKEKLDEALKEQRQTGEFLGKILVKMNIISENDLLSLLSEQFKIPLIRLKNRYIDFNLVKRFSSSLILDYRCIAVSLGKGKVTFAVINPLDVNVLSKAEQEARGLTAEFALTYQEDIDDAVRRYRQYMKGDIEKLFKKE